MGFFVQMWLPLLAIALTAAICFSVAWFIMERREASSNIISTSHQPISRDGTVGRSNSNAPAPDVIAPSSKAATTAP